MSFTAENLYRGWVYFRSEPGLWTVGHYGGTGDRWEWHAESDHASADAAAARVHYLNGGAALTYPPAEAARREAASTGDPLEDALASAVRCLDAARLNMARAADALFAAQLRAADLEVADPDPLAAVELAHGARPLVSDEDL